MPVEKSPAILQQCVTKIIEPPLRCNIGIELPHRTSGEIARISKSCESVALAFFIQLLESRRRHEQFAAHLEIRRDSCLLQFFFEDRKRNRADGAYIQGDIFTYGTVAASDPAHQLPVVVAERERHAVQLELANVVHVLAAAELVYAPFPRPQFFFAVSVVERQHGRGVAYLDKSFTRLATHPLGRRVGRNQSGMLSFELLQLLHERV